jgi:hypothetical protein
MEGSRTENQGLGGMIQSRIKFQELQARLRPVCLGLFALPILSFLPVLTLPTAISARLLDGVANYDPANQVMPPAKLSETGLYTGIATKARAVTEGIVHFEVNAALWSDAAHKDRWITLPIGTSIIPTDSDHYDFPDKTVMIKNFAVDTVVGDAKTSILVETRFMVIRKIGTTTAYRGISYAWRRDQSDADLVDPTKGSNAVILVKANGVLVGKRWRYPARGDCSVCHVNRGSLGFITPQLNRPSKTNASINQLQELFTLGILNKNPLATNPASVKWAALDDASASLELRARSYLASNCSHCHGNANQDFTGVRHNFDFLNSKMAFTYDPANPAVAGPYVGTPSFFDPEMPKLVYPGSPDSSFVLRRMLARGTFEMPEALQMPPLASFQPDSSALRVLADWICTLGNKPIGASCKLPLVPQDNYWANPARIQPHGFAAFPSNKLRANLHKGVLTMSDFQSPEKPMPILAKEISMVDMVGKPMALTAVGKLSMAVPNNLPNGVYFVRFRENVFVVKAGF